MSDEDKKSQDSMPEDIEKWYKACIEASDDSVYMIDPEGNYIFANEEHLSRLEEDGRIPDSEENGLTGRNIQEIHPEEDSEKLMENIGEVLKTGKSKKEENKFQSVGRCSLRTYSPVKDPESDEVKGVAVISKDMTEKKKTEKDREFLHSLLRHDIRNKMQVTRGYVELAKDFDLPEDCENYVEKAKKSLEEGVDIIEKIRNIRKVGEGETKGRNLDKTLRNVISEDETYASGEGMEIEYDNGSGYSVRGGELLEELFSNIVENSVKHSEGKNIRIRTEDLGDKVDVIVEDDGKGIPDEKKDKILDKGLSVGSSGGSGLGMYFVDKITENYGGEVEVGDSELGGARFDVYLEKVS
ncbi:MAG: PAS domain-containing sensor histidine kinase [Candidatus Aenigmatarchaeota archaeon]